jgi:ubiquinone/menaquinone biosynthesis C-methylase UbiE
VTSDGVKEAYNAWAACYDSDQPRRLRDLAATVLRHESLALCGAHIVELGCGTGTNTRWLAETACEVIAVDFSEPMLDRARRRATSPRVRFVCHDISEPWPIAGESADLVVASLVLEHIRDLTPVFGETQRVLKSGGLLFICEFHPFQQLLGRKSQFVDMETRRIVQIPAFRHDVSDFVNGGLKAGLRLDRMDEWRYEGEDATALPKIVCLAFARL